MSVLEYGPTMKILVLVFWLGVVGASVAAVFAPEDERLVDSRIATGFFLLVLSMHLESFHVSIRYDNDGLHTASPWRRKRFVPWSAIRGVRFSSTLQWYELSTSGFGCVRLPLYISGFRSLLDELAARGFSIPASTPPRK